MVLFFIKIINKIKKILYNLYTRKGSLFMKKILKILLILVIILVIFILILFYINNKNQNYLDDISKNISENYKLDEEITYSNIYGNYYILTTNTKVIVLNKEYEEVLASNIDILQENINNYDLIYKNNKLMYEETILKNNQLIYKYYDATNNKLIKETTMEQR